MNTLNEVIFYLENSQRRQTNDWNLSDAALFYLKEYRWLQEKCADLLAEKFSDQNTPLTWDELKSMEGKPVWVEADGGKYKNWFIVGNFFSWFAKEDFDAHVNLYRDGSAMEMSKEVYGSHWQAYRKERI